MVTTKTIVGISGAIVIILFLAYSLWTSKHITSDIEFTVIGLMLGILIMYMF